MLRLSSIKCLNILYSNKTTFKIGHRTDDVCTFCEALPETLYVFFTNAPPYSRKFWNDLESYWCLSNQQVRFSLQNFIFGIISKQWLSTKFLNYFIRVGKLFLWDSRRNQIQPKIESYQTKSYMKLNAK